LSEITLVLLAAGGSTRFGVPVKKQWLRVDDKPLWQFVADRFEAEYDFAKIIIVCREDEIEYMRNFGNYEFAAGGKERQDSLRNALEHVSTEYIMTSDVARCCFDEATIDRLVSAMQDFDCVIPVIKAPDTVLYNTDTIDRNNVVLVQTPQISKTAMLKRALDTDALFTDDSSAIKAIGGAIGFVDGSAKLKKLTSYDDLASLECLMPPAKDIFSGIGFDTHAFETGKRMVLGGVDIEVDYGFKAHSDGDVLLHSLIDALLGAAGLGDIGEHFPDTSETYKNIDSSILLHDTLKKVWSVGFEVVNVDITVIAEKPKLMNKKAGIRKNVAKMLGLSMSRVNIKATTAEKMGFVGRGEGVAVQSIANLKYFDWTKQ